MKNIILWLMSRCSTFTGSLSIYREVQVAVYVDPGTSSCTSASSSTRMYIRMVVLDECIFHLLNFICMFLHATTYLSIQKVWNLVQKQCNFEVTCPSKHIVIVLCRIFNAFNDLLTATNLNIIYASSTSQNNISNIRPALRMLLANYVS